MTPPVRLVTFLGAAAVQAVPATATPPVIDGYIEDRAWFELARVWDARDPRLPGNHARFYLAWDERNLYFAADVTDPDVTGTQRRRKDPVWEDDGVEFYIDFGDGTSSRRTPDTWQFAFSAAGGVNWMRGRSAPSDASDTAFPGHDWPAAWTSSLEWATRLKKGTTANMSGDIDAGYVVEARIPWSDFGLSPPFAPGRTVGLCFLCVCRPEMDLSGGAPLSTVPGIDFSNNHNPSLWERVPLDWTGPLPIRGLVRPLPAALGSSHPFWKAFAAGETDPQGPWLNRSTWTARLEAMASTGLNMLILEHPAPFDALLNASPDTASTGTGPPQAVDHAGQLRWLIGEAEARGIAVGLMTHGFGLESSASGEPGDRARRAADLTAALVRHFPGLAGLAPWAGTQNPPDDAMLESVIGTLRTASSAGGTYAASSPASAPATAQSLRPPRLLLHVAGLSPARARRILDALPDTILLHDLQGRQWFKPQPDPHLIDFAVAVDNTPPRRDRPAPIVAVGGPEGGVLHLAWSDPEWMRTLTIALRQRGLGGMLMRCWNDEDPLAVDSLGAYASDPGEGWDPQRWTALLDARYRTGERSALLLDALRAAGEVMPRVVALFHRREAWYMPQFGLPLIVLAELPTLSSYEEHVAVVSATSPAGSDPRRGGPDWGEQFLSLRQDAAAIPRAGATRPDDVARTLRRLADRIAEALPRVREAAAVDRESSGDAARLCDRLELAAALALHWAARIDTATAWERFAGRRQRAFDCVRAAQAALQHYRDVVRLAERVHPGPVACGLLRPVSPPPWTPDMIASAAVIVEGHWRDQLPRFERELECIRREVREVAAAGPAPRLPLWDELDAWPPEALAPVQRITFEAADDRRLHLAEHAAVSDDPAIVIEGSRSLRIDTRAVDDNDWHIVVTSDPEVVRIVHDAGHQVSASYRVLQRDDTPGEVFEIGVRPLDGGPPVGDLRRWTAPAGYQGRRFVKIAPLPHDGYVFFMAVRGRQVLVLDEIDIARLHH